MRTFIQNLKKFLQNSWMSREEILNFCRLNSKKTTNSAVLTNICDSLAPTNEDKMKIAFSPVGTYDENTNLLDIHNYVLTSFSKNKNRIQDMQQNINSLRMRLEKNKLPIVERNAISNQIKQLEKDIVELSSDRKYQEYLTKTKDIIEDWKKIVNTENVNSVFGQNKKSLPLKLNFVRNYIQTASNYTILNLTYGPSYNKSCCPYCQEPYENSSEEGKIICVNCGIYDCELSTAASFNDLSRINSSTNNYHNCENFRIAFWYIQGKIHVDFPADLESSVDRYREINHITKDMMTIDLTCSIFKSIKYTNYKAVHLFLFKYCQKTLPDYTDVEPMIFADQETFSREYEIVKTLCGDGRSSAMNAQFLAYILLKKNGIECDPRDFRIPSTPSTFKEIERLAKITYDRLKWTWVKNS